MSDGPIINVDMDGVVYDFPRAFRDMVQRHTGRTHGMPTTWDWWGEWSMSKGEWMAWFRFGVRSGEIWGDDGYEVPGASRALWHLSDAGYYIRLVTHRTYLPGLYEVAIGHTARWVARHRIPFQSLCFEGRKAGILADVVIDDNPGLEWVQNNADNYLFRRDYNAEVELPHRPRIDVVDSWEEILECLI